MSALSIGGISLSYLTRSCALTTGSLLDDTILSTPRGFSPRSVGCSDRGRIFARMRGTLIILRSVIFWCSGHPLRNRHIKSVSFRLPSFLIHELCKFVGRCQAKNDQNPLPLTIIVALYRTGKY